ncbi:phosphatase PAP2 family protein [Arthrobacter sp. NEB 688]|uniref:phosphatase PAP2 family protein n=1 Tax=Arthrobacter sp. NEB 688 TaxID=904039 RepID=UPI0015645D5E|nr:phosphatase PAP2 family protein [Arthrobacter sp. NEB 688]QKE85793.1 phosphatase PAP2 family protein [Arthrobacter sp. NEB 688]
MHTTQTPQRGLAGLRWVAGLRTAVVWLAGVTVLSIAVGFVAKSLTTLVDHPVFDAVERAGTNDWTDVLSTLTKMGNVWQTQRLAAVLAVGLAVWLWRRGQRWWMPLVVLPLTWIVSRVMQFGVAWIVDRDRDAISLLGTNVGAFPSGGVMRIVTVTGAAVFLASYYGRWERGRTLAGYAVVFALGVAEAYFRGRLNQHWFTDIIGGIIVGWAFLAAVAATVRAFDPSPRSTTPAADDTTHTSPVPAAPEPTR